MKSKAQRPIVEIAAEWVAACCIGGAVAFACSGLAPGAPVAAAMAGLAVAAGALLLLGRVDRDAGVAMARFEPVEILAVQGDAGVDDALLLDEPCEPGELLLDDPVPAAESRVVRLFTAGPEAGVGAAAIPQPGEMLARIEQFLGAGRSEPGAVPELPATAASAEASAALHAALADIRRSLRQA